MVKMSLPGIPARVRRRRGAWFALVVFVLLGCERTEDATSTSEVGAPSPPAPVSAPVASVAPSGSVSPSAAATAPRTTVRVPCSGDVCGKDYTVAIGVGAAPIGSVGAVNEAPCGPGRAILSIRGPAAQSLHTMRVSLVCGQFNELRNPADWTRGAELAESDTDIMRLFAHARRIAEAREPKAVLVRAVFDKVRDGALDFERGSTASFDYAYRYRDPARPPGEDEVSGEFMVDANAKGLDLRADHPGAPHSLEQRAVPPVPPCSATQVWEAVVQSGVPRTAVARMSYRRSPPGSSTSRLEWLVRVEGHDEMRRDVDAESCALGDGGPKARDGNPPPPSRPKITVTPSVVRMEAP